MGCYDINCLDLQLKRSMVANTYLYRFNYLATCQTKEC
jgi:hypothetical protein